MTFTSLFFLLLFFPITLILYRVVPDRIKDIVLFLASMIFYGMGEPVWFVLLLALTGINYAFYCYSSGRAGRKALLAPLVMSIILNLIPLLCFKYVDLFCILWNRMVGTEGAVLRVALPAGISFYTFQLISFQIDVYRMPSEQRAEKKLGFWNFAALICMFPRLSIGPLVHIFDLEKERQEKPFGLYDLESGLKLFAIGLSLKILLADRLATLWNSICVGGAEALNTPIAWLGAVTFSMQLYFDFWGYSVMAMGLGRCLGFRIPRNFKNPYCAKSMTDFWRRWHVTLGAWFREYVYIPLGGNRGGKWRTAINLIVVWILTGIWHGDGINFLIWGMLIVFLILLEKFTPFGKVKNIPVVNHLYILLIMPVVWMIFAWTDPQQLLVYLAAMVGITGSSAAAMDTFWRYLLQYAPFLAMGIVFCSPVPMNLYKIHKHKWYMSVVLIVLLWFSVYEMLQGANNPFLYLKF